MLTASRYQRRSGEQVLLQVNNVGLKYFETVGIKLVEGRDFDARDSGTAHNVAIINEAMARRYFAKRSPIGERFGLKKPDTEIIGVVRDARVTDVTDPAVPMVYYPMDQGAADAENLDVRATAGFCPARHDHLLCGCDRAATVRRATQRWGKRSPLRIPRVSLKS